MVLKIVKKMVQSDEIVFNPDRDIQEVDQFGYVDLVVAMQNGYVPGDVEELAERYNDIEEPASIFGKPKDCFEAMRMQDMVVANAKKGTVAIEPSARKSDSKSEN